MDFKPPRIGRRFSVSGRTSGANDQIRSNSRGRGADRYNIIKGFLSDVDWSAVQEWTKAAPGRFIASPFILKTGSSDLERLRPEYASGRFSGMREIATQLNGVRPNDPSLQPYFKLAEEFDITFGNWFLKPLLVTALHFGNTPNLDHKLRERETLDLHNGAGQDRFA